MIGRVFDGDRVGEVALVGEDGVVERGVWRKRAAEHFQLAF